MLARIFGSPQTARQQTLDGSSYFLTLVFEFLTVENEATSMRIFLMPWGQRVLRGPSENLLGQTGSRSFQGDIHIFNREQN